MSFLVLFFAATLDDLVHRAIENAPELAAAHASVAAARSRIEPARTLPDPMVAATYNKEDGPQLMVTQQWPWPGKRALAGRAATSEAREIEIASLGRAALTIEARVRNAWYDLQLAHALDRIADERRETAKQIEATTRERYAAGLAVQQDVLRAEIELARIDEMQSDQRATIASRTSELGRLVGGQAPPPVGSLPPITPVADDLLTTALNRSPELAAARTSIDTALLRLDLAHKNLLPDFVTSASSMPEVSAGISVPLFRNRRQRNEVAEAAWRTAERRADVDRIARDVEVKTRERIARLEAANQTAALYRDKVLPLDDVSLQSALASYQAGKVPFISVLDAMNTLYSDRAIYAQRLADAAKWRVAIDEVMP